MEKIADIVNAVGVAMRTTTEVREKWRNLHSQAKKEYSELSKEEKKTGGGPAPKMPSTLTAKVTDLFKETPFFTSLAGFESTGKDKCPLIILNLKLVSCYFKNAVV